MADEQFPMIDAHHHFWDPSINYHPWLNDQPPIPFRYGDYSSLQQAYLPLDYFRDVGHHRVVKTVYIETEWDPRDPVGETRWVDALHAQTGYPNAVVAQAWLDRDDVAEVLAGISVSPLVRSVRHKPAACASPATAARGLPGSMDDVRWRAGFERLVRHGLMFDLQTPWWHLDAALALASDYPQMTIILNHAGLPSDRSDQGLRGWHGAMAALADAPNVMVKISGIGQPGVAWTAQANRWIVRETIAIFGVERCMFASNFPVDGLCASFTTIFDGFKEITVDLPPTSQRALFHDNAARIYNIA